VDIGELAEPGGDPIHHLFVFHNPIDDRPCGQDAFAGGFRKPDLLTARHCDNFFKGQPLTRDFEHAKKLPRPLNQTELYSSDVVISETEGRETR